MISLYKLKTIWFQRWGLGMKFDKLHRAVSQNYSLCRSDHIRNRNFKCLFHCLGLLKFIHWPNLNTLSFSNMKLKIRQLSFHSFVHDTLRFFKLNYTQWYLTTVSVHWQKNSYLPSCLGDSGWWKNMFAYKKTFV